MWNSQEPSKKYATDCGNAIAYYQTLPIPLAAALWCAVPSDEIEWVLSNAQEIAPGIKSNAVVPCLEPKCRALHAAIEAGQLPVYRETGGACKDHVAPGRRHVSRAEFRDWISKHYPGEKTPTLFDPTEIATHSAINADAFRALQVDRDALYVKLNNAIEWYEKFASELDEVKKERDALALKVTQLDVPGARSETTYLNTIGGMLSLILCKSPAGKPHCVFENQSKVIDAMLSHHGHLPGIAKTTLQNTFAEANRSIKAT